MNNPLIHVNSFGVIENLFFIFPIHVQSFQDSKRAFIYFAFFA
jgi:hypothetical protein